MTDYTYAYRRYDNRHGVCGWMPSEFQRGAITAAFFTANPLPQSGEFEMDWEQWNAMDAADRAKFIAACEAFEAKYGRTLSRICERTGNDMEAAGRDYHYTSAGHGCGFWDGDWGAFGDALTRVVKRMPLPELYADLDCDHYRETGEGCHECEGCEAGPTFYVG